jgi:NAD(P)H-nitrite reductase large subunit
MEVIMKTRIVLIGAGPAGVTAVETLRTYDQESEVTMLSAEPYPPYSPPAMVDHFLRNSNAHLWLDDGWTDHLGVNYRQGIHVARIDPQEKEVFTSEDESIPYDRLVIATGSRLYAPLVGVEKPGVYNFKSLSTAEELVAKVSSGEVKTALIVGAGFIGMEIALLLRELGVEVTQLEMLDQVMPAMLDAQTAEFALDFMRQRGITVHLNKKAVAFTGEEQVKSVTLESGDSFEADIFIAATGIHPNTELLEGSGVEHDWGILVDDHLRTNFADIFAAGDVISVEDRLTGERYVHANFPNAVDQGRVVGLNLAGFDTRYEGAERMNSLKHLDLPIMAVGLKDGDEILSAKSNGNQRRIYLQDGHVVGYQLVGDIYAAGVLRTLMTRGENVAKYKNRLLERTFSQADLTWSSILV